MLVYASQDLSPGKTRQRELALEDLCHDLDSRRVKVLSFEVLLAIMGRRPPTASTSRESPTLQPPREARTPKPERQAAVAARKKEEERQQAQRSKRKANANGSRNEQERKKPKLEVEVGATAPASSPYMLERDLFTLFTERHAHASLFGFVLLRPPAL